MSDDKPSRLRLIFKAEKKKPNFAALIKAAAIAESAKGGACVFFCIMIVKSMRTGERACKVQTSCKQMLVLILRISQLFAMCCLRLEVVRHVVDA